LQVPGSLGFDLSAALSQTLPRQATSQQASSLNLSDAAVMRRLEEINRELSEREAEISELELASSLGSGWVDGCDAAAEAPTIASLQREIGEVDARIVELEEMARPVSPKHAHRQSPSPRQQAFPRTGAGGDLSWMGSLSDFSNISTVASLALSGEPAWQERLRALERELKGKAAAVAEVQDRIHWLRMQIRRQPSQQDERMIKIRQMLTQVAKQVEHSSEIRAAAPSSILTRQGSPGGWGRQSSPGRSSPGRQVNLVSSKQESSPGTYRIGLSATATKSRTPVVSPRVADQEFARAASSPYLSQGGTQSATRVVSPRVTTDQDFARAIASPYPSRAGPNIDSASTSDARGVKAAVSPRSVASQAAVARAASPPRSQARQIVASTTSLAYSSRTGSPQNGRSMQSSSLTTNLMRNSSTGLSPRSGKDFTARVRPRQSDGLRRHS